MLNKKKSIWPIALGTIVVTLVLIFLITKPASSIFVPDSPCKEDCTTYDNICHAECDGVNGCNYANSSYFGQSGLTTKEICDLQKKDWLKYFNNTHNIVCCDNLPTIKINTPQLNVTLDSNITDISTMTRTVNLNGKMVTMHITIWGIN